MPVGKIKFNNVSKITSDTNILYLDDNNKLNFINSINIVRNSRGILFADLDGNADTATTLQTTIKIGGVDFDGSAPIDLPGVNQAGTQNTSGNADTATSLQTTIKIGGIDFDGSAPIDLPGVNQAGTQNTSGNADTATTLQTTRKIGGVDFDGSAPIDLPGVNQAGTQNTSGSAAKITSIENNNILLKNFLLDNNKIKTEYLPSYVDDIINFASVEQTPTKVQINDGITSNLNAGVSGDDLNNLKNQSSKIYVNTNTNKVYRYSGSEYVEISASLAIGEGASTAFEGSRGLALEGKVNGLEANNSVTDSNYNGNLKLTFSDGNNNLLDNDGLLYHPFFRILKVESNNSQTYQLLLSNSSQSSGIQIKGQPTVTQNEANITHYRDVLKIQNTGTDTEIQQVGSGTILFIMIMEV